MTSAIQRVALYARVSASNGHQDPEMQLRELRDFVERRGWQISSEYVDNGISGSKDSRPALNQLMADAGRRKFDAVIVWRFDRFARSVSRLLRALEVFQALGVDFISLSENVDTSTPTGKMVFTVRGAVAEHQRSLIVERVKAGLRNSKVKGKRLGRPRTVIDESRVEVLRASGASWRAIAKDLGGLGWAQPTERPSGVPKTYAGPFLNGLRRCCLSKTCTPFQVTPTGDSAMDDHHRRYCNHCREEIPEKRLRRGSSFCSSECHRDDPERLDRAYPIPGAAAGNGNGPARNWKTA